jgi:antitoxin component YwqK of YwqJK toxin-antitoxin module
MRRINADDIELGNDYVYRLDGKPFTGIGFELNDDGQLLSEIEFENGLKNGFSREWAIDGTLVSEHEYRNNTRHGHQVEWADGKLHIEEVFEYGICVNRKEWDHGKLVKEFVIDQSDPQFMLLAALRLAIGDSS